MTDILANGVSALQSAGKSRKVCLQQFLENAALRQQLAVLKQDVKRPKLRGLDSLFWIALGMIWNDWESALVIVWPET
jgi:hypothetical protein